ncbi:MAG: dynamin family protein [Cyanobacteria bacterium]|nr:dynamin family protein [Cyanobacteria bacterium CG_2015-16_32_12]NCO79156.1 dynamin family protein [Cyanobacteria bacterium CG_2015-22_32_23]NCS85414.1 dynamin family protein [Cyanobacteria bacterium CG_2015-02_32_10]
MNTNDLKPNIYGLQQDVLNLLGNVSKLMGDVKETLSGDNSGEKYGDYQQDIDNAVVNVKELELRMAVVAPMKAGKSTIINAIVGDDLLPSRNAAMTTIPTEIILKKELTQPILILSEHIRKVFKGCYIALKEKIQKLKIEKTLEEKTGQYPHLRELIEEIYNLTENELPNFLDSEKIEGKENIGKALTSLNDIIRLVSILDPNFDPIQKLREVPRIETGFCQISENGNQSEQFGNLVIIDTPGPNEAGENLKLSYVVENQLEKSSVVLIVLDFTQLNNKAAEDVKRQVKPIIDLRGKENLYVLVNKVDQRRDGDMTPNIVKQFVFNDLKLSESENTDKVFEISARKAFCANRFLLDLQNQDIDTKQKASIMPSSKTLAQEVFGMDWEEDLEEVTIKQLQKKANKLKEKSGFNIFLSQTISVLMENAAPKCLKSSLNIAYNHLISVRDEVKLRGSAIAQDEEKLRLEIEALEADLKRLELCRTKLQEVDKIKAKLEQQLNLILDDLKKDALVKIEMFYSEEEYNQADWREKGEKSIKNVVSWVAKQIGAKIDSEKKQTILEFETEQKAQQFIGNTIAFGKQRTESHLLNVRKKVQVIIENKRNELAKSVEEEAKPIIEKAKQRLKETFDVDLELRSPTFSSNQNLNLNYIKATSKTRNIDQGYDTVSYQQRHWWHWAWIVPKEYTKKVKKADKKVAYYTVSLEEITLQFNDSLETSIKSMNQEIAKYLDEDFKHRIDNYFEKLDAYLTNYRDDIKQAQKDQKLSLEEQTKLTDKLNSIIPQVNEKVEESQKLTEIINELIK